MIRTLLPFVLAALLQHTASAQTSTADTAPSPAAEQPAIPAAVANAPAKISSLIIVDEKIGDGVDVTPGMYLDMHYTGWIYNSAAPDRHGAMFDTSRTRGQPLTFQMDARTVIRGWDIGVKGMKVGGKRTLIIPSYLAYGTKGGPSIPPNTPLIFDIELVGAR